MAAVRDQLRRQGYSEVRTAAVHPKARDRLITDGFTAREYLYLLSHDLMAIPALPRRRTDIRRGRRSDHYRILQVDSDAFEESWRFDHQGLREALIAAPVGRLRVIEGSDGIRAYSVTGLGGTQCYLQRLAVAVRHQGHGFGAALVADALRWARSRKATVMWVNTQESNRHAVDFYQRLGFTMSDRQLTVLHRAL